MSTDLTGAGDSAPAGAIPTVVTRALGCMPAVRQLLPEMRALPDFDADRCAKLEIYALALLHAEASVHTAIRPPDGLDGLTAEGTALRDALLADARALIQRGLLPSHVLDKLTGRRGYLNLSTDLAALAILLPVWCERGGRHARGAPRRRALAHDRRAASPV